jgi:hypothetical protein
MLAYLIFVAAELAAVAWFLWQIRRDGRRSPLNHDSESCLICRGREP